MTKPTYSKRVIHTIAAATLFATQTRDANEIAGMLDTSDRSVHRWSHEPLWHQTLDTLGYEGERNFRVQPARDPERDDDTYQPMKTAYLQAISDEVPKAQRASHVAEITGQKAWKVRYWARRYGWDT